MGSLNQEINLYRADSEQDRASSQARVLLITVAALFAGVLLLALVGELYLADMGGRRDAVAERLHRQQQELERVRGQLVEPTIDPFLTAELEGLRAQLDHVNANLAALARVRPSATGFAEFFAGLARNTIDGLWFDGVVLSSGGDEVMLKGVALEPSLVPRLLQTLAVEPAFSGRSFRKASFDRLPEEQGGLVGFELRSAHVEGADDAG